MPTVLNDWVNDLTYMQQSVLLCAIRNHDGFNKHNPAKEITRYLRRVILKSAFDGRMLQDPFEPGGGNFTGPMRTATVYDAGTAFLDGRDEMSLHYWLHAVHAFEIIGYMCPIDHIRIAFHKQYMRCISAMHVAPESKHDMEKRLSDNEEKWLERSDAYERAAHQKEKAKTWPIPLSEESYNIRQANVARTEVKDGVFTETYTDGSSLSGLVGAEGCSCHGAVGVEGPAVEIDRPSDGEIYTDVSNRITGFQDANARAELSKLAPGQGDQGYPEPPRPTVPGFAATLDGHFVNIQTGLQLGHEFDLMWKDRYDEFPVYAEPGSPLAVKRVRDNLGASDYDG